MGECYHSAGDCGDAKKVLGWNDGGLSSQRNSSRRNNHCPGCTHGIAHRLVMEAWTKRAAWKGYRCRAHRLQHSGPSLHECGYVNPLTEELRHSHRNSRCSPTKSSLRTRETATWLHRNGRIVQAALREKFTTIFINNASTA